MYLIDLLSAVFSTFRGFAMEIFVVSRNLHSSVGDSRVGKSSGGDSNEVFRIIVFDKFGSMSINFFESVEFSNFDIERRSSPQTGLVEKLHLVEFDCNWGFSSVELLAKMRDLKFAPAKDFELVKFEVNLGVKSRFNFVDPVKLVECKLLDINSGFARELDVKLGCVRLAETAVVEMENFSHSFSSERFFKISIVISTKS
jgi:hypothetical protein